MKAKKQFRGGMTLVELLVVIAIISLLAVSVSPLFQAGSERRRFTEAADVVSGHFNAVIARSIGRAAGDGAWLDATVGPAGAVTSLGFTRARNISGDITVTTVNPPTVTDPPYADVTFAPPLPLAPPAIAGLIHVAGYPYLRPSSAASPASDSWFDSRRGLPDSLRLVELDDDRLASRLFA